STSLRSATDAPPGWALSHCQWRGSRVTSRATTPSFGRPRPRGLSEGVASAEATAGSGIAASALSGNSARRRTRSAMVPPRLTSTGCWLASAEVRRWTAGSESSAWRAASATCCRVPAASRRCAAKELQRVAAGCEACMDGVMPGWMCRSGAGAATGEELAAMAAPTGVAARAPLLHPQPVREPVVDGGGGDRGVTHGHRDLVERADHVADRVQAVHAGLLVGIGAQRTVLVHIGTELARELRL